MYFAVCVHLFPPSCVSKLTDFHNLVWEIRRRVHFSFEPISYAIYLTYILMFFSPSI